MGIMIKLGDKEIEAQSYTVRESASPLTAGDSSGGVGSITVTIPKIDPEMPARPGSILAKLQTVGAVALKGEDIEIVDSRRGVTSGTVTDISESESSGTITLTCSTRLLSLNIYNVQAAPYVGTLRGAFDYYLSLAGATTNISIPDAALASRPVTYPGWKGELWYNLKMMAAAQDADIALVSGVITMRPIRERTARFNRAGGVTRDFGGGSIALAVEVYQYNNREINGEMVWPIGDLSGDGQIFSVNAGEVTEYALSLSSSLTSIVQPTPQNWVAPYEMSASVYSIISNDGQKVPADAWTLHGGSVRVILNPDTMSARLIIRGPKGLTVPKQSGEEGESVEATSFALAEYADGNQARRPSLRLIGSGVAFAKEKITIPTGVNPNRTENAVGATIDNPYLSTADEVYRAGTRAALEYSGLAPTLSAEVISVNRKGDSGNIATLTYAELEAYAKATWGAAVTYSGVVAGFAAMGHDTYGKIAAYISSLSPNQFENQVFGNTAGARVFDKKSRRWYRVRDVSFDEAMISVTAENDMNYADVQAHYGTRTYNQVQAIFAGMTYEEQLWAGLYG